MTKHIHVSTHDLAWELVGKLAPSEYQKDERKSDRAGHDILTCVNNPYNWISVLINCLEINLKTGITYRIWIDNCKTA